MKNKVELMLDSGAFSTWNRGEPDLDLKAYIKFIQDNKSLLFSYVNLDKMPGVFGAKRTSREVETSAKKSYDNLQIMKSHGLKPIPVFHLDEDVKWFERYLKDGETYIGISPAGQNPASKMKLMERLFVMICDSKGEALIRTHGFGMTASSILVKFPWYTTDSTTWALAAGFGKIPIPPQNLITGKPDYGVAEIRIAVSGVACKPNNPSQFEAHTFFASQGLREEYIRWWIEKEVGTTLSEVRNVAMARRRAWLVYYVNFMKYAPPIRLQRPIRSIINPVSSTFSQRAKVDRLRIMFASNIRETDSADLMNEVGAMTRLLSYYELKNVEDGMLKEFVRTGTNKIEKASRQQRAWKGKIAKNRHIANLIRYKVPEEYRG
jgi:hypothetical protein